MIAKLYLHSDKESNFDKAEELGLPEKATSEFKYALYEVEFEVDIDEETGKCEILKVDGRDLSKTN